MLPQRTQARFSAFVAVAYSLLMASAATGVEPDANASLIAHSQRGDAQTLADLLRQGADPNSISRVGKSALLSAAGGGHVEVMQLLVDAGADVNAKTSFGSSPLIEAATARNSQATAILLKAGAAPDADALGQAAWLGRKDTALLLLDAGVAPSAGLARAAQGGNLEIVQLLLDRGANLADRLEGGSSALHLAALQGGLPTVRLLLKRKADPNALDDNDNTPLHKAIYGHGELEVIQALVAAGARLDLANDEGLTPVRVASIRGERRLYDWLVEHNGGNEPSPVNPPDVAAPKDSIDEAFKNLASKDRLIRLAAQRRLVLDHQRALPEILRRVDAGEPIEKYGDILTAMGPPAAAAIPRLASKLGEKKHALGAVILINRIHPDAFAKLPAEQQAAAAEALRQVIIDPNSDVMGGFAIQALASLGKPATPAILSLLEDANPRLRAAMIRRLRQSTPHDEKVAAALLQLAQHDPVNEVRVKSIIALSGVERYRDQLRGISFARSPSRS